MQILLRTRRVSAEGIDEYLDTELEATAITIGGAPDQTIQLIGANVAPEHATISVAGDAINIRCRRGKRVLVNGESVRSARLTEGDRIEIDGHQLQFVRPPAGFDAALELVPNPAVQASDFAHAFRTELTQTWLSRRRVAWLLFIVILTATLLVPLGALVWHNDAVRSAAWQADVQWSPGALHPAHQLASGGDCTTCHAVPFVRVSDAACTTCHDRTHDHVAATRAVKMGLDHTRCATCHQEHHEPPHLVVTSDTACTDCHAAPARFEPIAKLAPVSGFTQARHPAFNAELLRSAPRAAGTGLAFDWRFETTKIAGAKETSNLRFPHDVHLDASKVQRVNDSAPLQCADCHQPAPAKEHFPPVTMEQHCISCHDLKFDAGDPTRELPHAQPTEAILTIEGHYLRKFGDPNLPAGDSPKRRLPDRKNDDERCDEGAYTCAMRKTLDEAVNQFTRRGCVTCHIVDDTGGSDLYSRFQVHPIRLVANYLPMTRFNHTSHLTQKGVTGDAACGSCHDALHSKDSADLLIPDIDNCVQCHSDQPARGGGLSGGALGGVALGCNACHVYHPERARLAVRESQP
jgi:predicted CXXCH cytochrome family protein